MIWTGSPKRSLTREVAPASEVYLTANAGMEGCEWKSPPARICDLGGRRHGLRLFSGNKRVELPLRSWRPPITEIHAAVASRSTTSQRKIEPLTAG